MKLRLFLLIALSSVINKSFSQQNYFPLLDRNAVWCEKQTQLTELEQWYWLMSENSKFFKDDTVINGLPYSKLYRSSHNQLYDPVQVSFSELGFVLNEYIGALREDTANHKVYFFSPDCNSEFLLYDFDLAAGDSFNSGLWCSPGIVNVISVDSIMVNGSYHKRINFGGYVEDVSWIEGVGSTTGLLGGFLFFENTSTLFGLSVNGELIYSFNPIYTSCVIINSISEGKEHDSAFEIFPNPAHDQTSITCYLPPQPEATLSILNLQGKKIEEIKLNSQQGKFSLDVSRFAAGVYILQLRGNDGVITKKLVKE